MKKTLVFTFLTSFSLVIFFGNNQNSMNQVDMIFSGTAYSKTVLEDCSNGAKLTGKQYNVIGTSINIRSGPGMNHKKLVNEKATKILGKTHYLSIDDTTIVFEKCTKANWSWIRILEPDWLRKTHRGWVLSKFLDKGQIISRDSYKGRISATAIIPYNEVGYPKTVAEFRPRLKIVEEYKQYAAEMAIDTGKCDFVEIVDLSTKSRLYHLIYWVDCRNGRRFYFDEFMIISR